MQVLTESVLIRVTPAQKAKFAELADLAGKSRSEYFRCLIEMLWQAKEDTPKL